jgi:hypothetical protein
MPETTTKAGLGALVKYFLCLGSLMSMTLNVAQVPLPAEVTPPLK